ncbi:MAG: HEAT repeat domain-containing protein [Actinomycetota bacterium]|nr:HEAT repeat domain-containing protein [Actinomycetota bacterium]
MKKLLIFFSALLVLFIIFTPINSNLFARGEDIEESVEEILTGYRAIGDPEKSDLLAELGSPAVPVLIEKLQSRFSWIAVEALGKIGDKSATPVLLERLESAENFAQSLAIIRALAMIGDPEAEPAILGYFEQEQNNGSIHQLETAQALLKVAGETSKQKVNEMVSYVMGLYQRAYWTFDEESLEEIYNEFISSPFNNEEIVHAFLAGLIIELKDPELITSAIKYQQLADESGPRFVDGFKVILESGETEAVETVFKFAENSEEMWPPAPPDITREERELYFSVRPVIRVSAVEALLELEGVDIQRVTRAFEDISYDDANDIPITVKFDPEKWDYSWKNESSYGVVTCYLGNLAGYDVSQIKVDTIKMNNQITVTGEGEVINEKEGFLGGVLKVEFDSFEAINTLQSVWPGAECLITITGELAGGGSFSRTLKVQALKYPETTATASIRLMPGRWSLKWYEWVKEHKDKSKIIESFASRVSVLCTISDLKDLQGNTIIVTEIVPETIKLNNILSPQPWGSGSKERLAIILGPPIDQNLWENEEFREWYERRGFKLPRMMVRFNMFEAIGTLPDEVAGSDYDVSITGTLKDGTSFEGTAGVTIK